MPEQKENELLRCWTNLKEGKKGHDIEMWLQKWETTYDDCVAIKLLDITEKCPIQAFINAVESIDSGFTITIKVQLLQGLRKEDPGKAFRDVIRQFRDWRQMSHDSKSRGFHSIFLSTLQGQAVDGESTDTNESPSQEKKGRKYKD